MLDFTPEKRPPIQTIKEDPALWKDDTRTIKESISQNMWMICPPILWYTQSRTAVK